MTKTTKLVHPIYQQEATVNMDEAGNVSVVKIDGTIDMRGYDFNDVVAKFVSNDWVVVEEPKSEVFAAVQPIVVTEAEEVAEETTIPTEIQTDVDEYLRIHEEKSQLEAKLKKLKETVSGYMKKNDIDEIKGTKGKRVMFQAANASNSTSTYTDYEMVDIVAALQGDSKLINQVTEVRVNAKKVEGLIKLGNLSEAMVEDIKSRKIVKAGTPRFTVKK